MTPRQIRRAAEHRQRKLAYKAAKANLNKDVNAAEAPAERTQPIPPLVSPSRLAANRANAHLSTGPKTPEGKSKSSLNAVKTGLTGRTVLLPADDAAAYEAHVRAYVHELRPVGLREHALVQSLADADWRLERVPALEIAIYSRGRIEFATQFEHEDAALRPGLIDLETYLAYEKQLRNLQLQEARLRRQREKDTAELRNLQKERYAREQDERDAASKLPVTKEDCAPVRDGFEFSTPTIHLYSEAANRSSRASSTPPQQASGATFLQTQAA